MQFLTKRRFSWAFSAGRWEHRLSLVLGILLIAVSITIVLKPGSIVRRGLEYLWLSAALLWILYYSSHRLEKWLRPQ